MAEFVSYRSYWHFARETARARRYIRTPEATAFLDTVAATRHSRERLIPKGRIVWRAQLGHDWRYERGIDDEMAAAFPPERMKPLTDRAYEGRVNAKDIPSLYMATTLETAISEVRPWIGSLVSAGQFQTLRDLRVIDCSVNAKNTLFYLTEPDAPTREQAVWANIDYAFSEPTTRSDDTAEYAATQVLAELFRDLGYDGVVYKSSFGDDGFNVALFDLDAARLVNCTLYKVRTAAFTFGQEDNTYFVVDKPEKPKAGRRRSKPKGTPK